MAEKLLQITADPDIKPGFCAGLVIDDFGVYRFAPILFYMEGWSLSEVIRHCRRKGWGCHEVERR